MRSLVPYNFKELYDELSEEFKEPWMELLIEEGWGGLLGRHEDWLLWVWCAAGRQQI